MKVLDKDTETLNKPRVVIFGQSQIDFSNTDVDAGGIGLDDLDRSDRFGSSLRSFNPNFLRMKRWLPDCA